jgi:hypothetical protein
VLLAKEETALQGIIDRLFGIGRCCGMQMNVENIKVKRISRQTSRIQIKKDKKEQENVNISAVLVVR